MILDAGVLVSADRGETAALSFRVAAERAGRELHTTAPVVAQVWRGGPSQARLARFIKSLTVHEFDEIDGRRIGEMLGRTGTADVTDAHLVVTAANLGMDIVTGDRGDIGALVDALPSGGPAVRSWP